ncbi:MAG: ribosome maturation factor RimP [Candidatus Omnitrophota bacterium]
MSNIQDIARQVVEKALKGQDFMLIDLDVKSSKRGCDIKITVDKERTGITLDDCASINKHLREIFDENGALGNDYTLEVSSPGLDRDLKKESDFVWAKGKTVSFITRVPVMEKKTNITGVITAVEQNIVEIQTEDNEKFSLNIDEIVKAKLEVRW